MSTSSSPIVGFSHAIVWVRDLEAAAARYRRLGFAPSQFYLHPKAVGTANYNMMFKDDYLELLTGVEDNPRNRQRLVRLAAEGDGLKDMSLLTKDADAAFTWVRDAGFNCMPVYDHHRPEGSEDARFRIIYMPPDELLPVLGFHVCQRLTPELMWRSANTTHANGAAGIAGVILSAPDPAALAKPYSKLFGFEPRQASDGSLTVKAGKATLRFATPSRIAELFPDIRFQPKPPFAAALELFVDDPTKAKSALGAAKVPYRSAPDGAVEVPPQEACGVVLRFVAQR